MAGRTWSRRKGLAAGAFAIVWGTILIFLVVSTALDAGKGPWAALLVIVIGALCFVPTLLVTSGAPENPRHWSAWLQKGPLSSLYVAIYAAFGAMTGALVLIEPRPATSDDIDRAAARILGRLDKAERVAERAKKLEPRIVREIQRVWGADECAVTFQFEIRGDALIVTALRRPAGEPPFRMVAEITKREGDVLKATGKEPKAARGMGATFTYSTTGASKQLEWDDEVGDNPTKLRPCEAVRSP